MAKKFGKGQPFTGGHRAPDVPVKPTHPKPPWLAGVRSEPDDRGIVVSIGPRDKDAEWLRMWMTFPVTPESIPITVSAAWQETPIIGDAGGEFSSFTGRNLDSISFSGRLEPPLYYRVNPDGPSTSDPVRYGDLDEAATMKWAGAAARIPGTSNAAFPSVYNRNDIGVVMEQGARAGPNGFYEPHAFKEIVTKIVKHGEVVRLVIGDSYGWSGLASIREFSWRYEDPDPDVLLFDITFRQHRDRELAGVTGTINKDKKKKASSKSVTTRRGDSLYSLAQEHLGDGDSWTKLRELNAATLGKLWLWDTATGGTAAPGGEFQLAHKVRSAGATPAPKKFPAHQGFAEGISLRLK